MPSLSLSHFFFVIACKNMNKQVIAQPPAIECKEVYGFDLLVALNISVPSQSNAIDPVNEYKTMNTKLDMDIEKVSLVQYIFFVL